MRAISRRKFNALLASTGLAAATAGVAAPTIAQSKARVVIVGGGPGGAAVANRLRDASADLDIVLIEAQSTYTTCFYSNLYIGGFRSYASLVHSYDGLKQRKIQVVTDRASAIDVQRRRVALTGGRTVAYDRLVVAPGIDLKFDSIEGYSSASAEIMPHAWRGGVQTILLKQRLTAMSDGGLVVIAAPPAPYRCPPGPYERACMIAHFLKLHKPKSKLLILDAKATFSKQAVFEEVFATDYKGIIELALSNEIDDFTVTRVDTKSGEVFTRAGRREKAAVANIIPPNRAGLLAIDAGLADGDWCPVDLATFASKQADNVYVLGDSANSADMPKSAFSAHSQAAVVAGNILADLGRGARPEGKYRNTCWSMLGPGSSAVIGADYAPGLKQEKPVLVASNSFVSQPFEPELTRKSAYEDSLSWYQALTGDIFAK